MSSVPLVQVIDGLINARIKVCTGDDTTLHKNDFLWLFQAITKVANS